MPHPPTPSPGGEGEKEQDNQKLSPLSPGRGVGVRRTKKGEGLG